MNRKYLLSSIMIAALMVVTSFAVLASSVSSGDDTRDASISDLPPIIKYLYQERGPISINGNSDLTETNGVKSGSGTQSDPYIIVGWKIQATTADGIHIANTDKHLHIIGCKIENGVGSGHSGIRVESSANVDIANNICISNSMGIAGLMITNGTIAWNDCHNNTEGIFIEMCSSNVTIDHNEVYGNQNGIYNNDAWNTVISRNKVHNNAQCGIIMTYGSVIVTVVDNNVTANGVGISVSLNSYFFGTQNIHIYHNSLIGNSVQATDNNNPGCTRWNTTGSGNYWNDWTTPDADLNGIVDNPYTAISAGTGEDWHPLTRPFTSPPTCVITSPTADAFYNTTSSTILLGGIATDDYGIMETSFYIPFGGGGYLNSSGLGEGPKVENWSIEIPLLVGENPIIVSVSDVDGNFGSDTIIVTYTPQMSCTINSPTNGSTYFTNWGFIKIDGVDGSEYTVKNVTWINDRGGSGIAYGTTNWQSRGQVQLFPGVNVITVTANDVNGNSATDTLTITYEKVLPIVTITSPASNPTYSTNSATINIGGSASDASGIATVVWKNKATGASGTASGTTDWSITGIALNSGMNLIYVNATDNAGNKGSDAIWVTYSIDTLAVTITSPTSNPTMTTSWHYIKLMGTASDDVKVTNVIWIDSLGGSGIAYMNPQWGAASVSWQSRGNVHLLPGDNVITVTAYDSAGNSKTDVLTVTYTGL